MPLNATERARTWEPLVSVEGGVTIVVPRVMLLMVAT